MCTPSSRWAAASGSGCRGRAALCAKSCYVACALRHQAIFQTLLPAHLLLRMLWVRPTACSGSEQARLAQSSLGCRVTPGPLRDVLAEQRTHLQTEARLIFTHTCQSCGAKLKVLVPEEVGVWHRLCPARLCRLGQVRSVTPLPCTWQHSNTRLLHAPAQAAAPLDPRDGLVDLCDVSLTARAGLCRRPPARWPGCGCRGRACAPACLPWCC